MIVISGFHAIEEHIRRNKDDSDAKKHLTVYVAKSGPRIKKMLKTINQAGISVKKALSEDLDRMALPLPACMRDHRGILLIDHREQQTPVSFEQLLSTLSVKQRACLVFLDGITDPHNIGAIIRSSEQFSADAVIIQHKPTLEQSSVLSQTSAGANVWIPLVSVSNIARAIEQCKKAGFWVYSADIAGTPLPSVRFAEKTALIFGSEGAGISRLLKEKTDFTITIPTTGKIDSLNVSVATGIVLYAYSIQN